MKQMLSFLMCIFALSAVGQEKIELDSVKSYAGKTVQVRGKVAQISFLGKGKNRQIVIYVGGLSSKEKLSVILAEEKDKPHFLLKDNRFVQSLVVATGKVEVEKGRARMVVKNDRDLTFIVDEEVVE